MTRSHCRWPSGKRPFFPLGYWEHSDVRFIPESARR